MTTKTVRFFAVALVGTMVLGACSGRSTRQPVATATAGGMAVGAGVGGLYGMAAGGIVGLFFGIAEADEIGRPPQLRSKERSLGRRSEKFYSFAERDAAEVAAEGQRALEAVEKVNRSMDATSKNLRSNYQPEAFAEFRKSYQKALAKVTRWERDLAANHSEHRAALRANGRGGAGLPPDGQRWEAAVARLRFVSVGMTAGLAEMRSYGARLGL